MCAAGCGGATPPPRSVSMGVVTPNWATDAPSWASSAEGEALEQGLQTAPGVVLHSLEAQCEDDEVTCLRETAERAQLDYAVGTTLAELGGTVMVRVTSVEVLDEAPEALRQVVVQDASAERLREALAAIGREISEPFLPPEAVSLQWYEHWWLWAIVGVAVAGGAISIFVLTDDQPREPDVTLSPP